MTRLAICAALLTTACASLPAIPPGPVHQIPVGLTDGFHALAHFDTDCPAMIRTPQLSGSALGDFLAANPCLTLALIEAPDVALVTEFAKAAPAAIELGNELELKPYELTPSQYGDWIGRAAVALQGLDYQGVVVLGGVYAITTETKAAIRFGLDSCVAAGILRCVVGVHLYDASDADLAWLRALNWPIWVTEVGAHTNCRPSGPQEQYDWLAAQIARFSTVPQLERVFLYQRADGPSCSDLDTFGISGKPAASLLR